jgi:hypothetical protein
VLSLNSALFLSAKVQSPGYDKDKVAFTINRSIQALQLIYRKAWNQIYHSCKT